MPVVYYGLFHNVVLWPYDISANISLNIIARGLGNTVIILDGFVTDGNQRV